MRRFVIAVGILLATTIASAQMIRDTSVIRRFVDTPNSPDKVIEIDHFSDETQAYGLDIQNYPDSISAPTPGTGASSALVIHQYSDYQPAVWIDNTRSQPFIRMMNTKNAVLSAGTFGNGEFFDFWGATTGSPNDAVQLGVLNDLLAFVSNDSSRPWTFQSLSSADSLRVQKSNATTGFALRVNQDAADPAINVSQNGGDHGVVITATAGAAGFYPLLINGQNYGGKTIASTNGGIGWWVEKTATGAGTVLQLSNDGTGQSVVIENATRNIFSIDNLGMPRIGQGNTTATPTCDATRRGTIYFVEGGAGVKDSASICAKDALDAYAWRTIY